MDPEHGSLKATLTRSGNLLVQVRFYGFTENVSILCLYFFLKLMITASTAGSGKSVIWCDNLSIVYICELRLVTSSTIIEDIYTLQKSRLASLAFFYCDFKEDQKTNLRGLLSSLLVQLCEQSDAYFTILSDFYVAHGHGSQHASDSELVGCLKDILKLPGQATVYIVIDALDECPITTGSPSPREEVLELVEELVNLNIPNLRICVTSRTEFDIVSSLEPLAFRSISLHDESGQVRDIAEYVRSVIHTGGSEMRRWKAEHKQLVIDVLIMKADGMYVIYATITLSASFTRIIQVPLGLLSARIPPPLYPSKYSAGSGGITRDAG
jgi:hypothetical protein